MKTINKIIAVFISCFILLSCSDDFFDTENRGVVTSDDIENLGDDVLKVVEPLQVGIYSYMTQWNTADASNSAHGDFGYMSIGLLGDVMNDDLAFHTRGSGWFTFDHELDYWAAQYIRPFFVWNFGYTLVNRANEIIEKIDFDTDNIELKGTLGQALSTRALGHFIVIQMYQQTYKGNETAPGIPVVITQKEGESRAYRVPVGEVYDQIYADLENAIKFLEAWERPSKVYIDKNVAAGLMSRVCLVMNKWDDAVKYAKMGRDGFSVLSASELLLDGFNNIDSKEWIWGADITGETTTSYASFFSHMCSYDAGYGGDVGTYKKMDAKLYGQMKPTDVRRGQFKVTGSGYTYNAKELTFPDYTNIKFKKVDNWLGDYVFMRTSEMILTEAEALAQDGKGPEAAIVLKELMTNRDPAWNESSVTAEQVYQQRRLELWGEGFSHWDHLRLKKGIERKYNGTNHIASAQYNIPAGSWYFLYQIPLRELDNNSEINEADQNPAPSGSKTN
jgi:hypothetical protein